MRTLFLCALVLAASTLRDAPPASAQRTGPRVIQLERMVVHGRRQAPGAFYLIRRTALAFSPDALRASFVGKIAPTVRRRPF